MDQLKIYSQNELRAWVSTRSGETKLGEKAQTIRDLEELPDNASRFVLLGIPEDIGIRANHGIAGAKGVWPDALKAILNIQSNHFLDGEQILVLGHFEIKEPKSKSTDALRKKTAEIDELVWPVIEKITTSGKIPIIIGGGHNNAYPIIKGVSTAQSQAIDVVNIDAHADLRSLEGRHSGNGFSYAINEDYLKQYGIFGLQQSYNNTVVLKNIGALEHLKAVFLDDLLINAAPIEHHWQEFIYHFKRPYGLEIDLDSIGNILSSAATPSGFHLNDVRKLVLNGPGKRLYLHICEGAVELANGRKSLLTGKAIACLVSDFIKSQR